MPIVLEALVATVTVFNLRHELSQMLGDCTLGTATAATSTSLTDTKQRVEGDGYWDGADLKVYAGTGAGQARPVTAFLNSANRFTFPSMTTTPDATSLYELHQLLSAAEYDRYIVQALRMLTRTRKLLQWKLDTSLAWVTDQRDYIVPTGFVAIQQVEVATVANPGSDDYEKLPAESWSVRRDGTRYLTFGTRFPQQTNGRTLRLTGYAEFPLPAADTDTYNLDPYPILVRAAALVSQALAANDATGEWRRHFENFRQEAELAEQKVPQQRHTDVVWVDEL